jgi:hypothetical protein
MILVAPNVDRHDHSLAEAGVTFHLPSRSIGILLFAYCDSPSFQDVEDISEAYAVAL